MKKKILFGITSLTIGGAERVLIDLANSLCNEYDITIFTIYARGELEKMLDQNVKLQTLYPFSYQDLKGLKRKALPLILWFFKKRMYQKYIKKDYDVEIAFLEGPITRLFSVKNKKVKKMAWVHNDISLVFGKSFSSFIKKHIDRKIYEKYQMLIFVSKDNRDKFETVYPDIRDAYLQKIPKRVVYNYIDAKKVLQKAQTPVETIQKQDQVTFITVARLVEQKAIQRLVMVHEKLIQNGFFHTIYVIGDGPLKEQIEREIQERNVQNTFILLGQKENPYPYVKQADIFCLLSYFEGLPIVVEEAKILNKPILITDTAAREGVENYPHSTIVENTQEAIYKVLEQKIRQGKPKNIQQYEYSNEKMLEKVKKVIGE